MRSMILLSALLLSSTIQAQVSNTKIPGRYAHNGLEKICLRLDEQQRFQLFTSTCTMDDHLVGRWDLRADTVVLNSDRQPKIKLQAEKQRLKDSIGLILNLALTDPALGAVMTMRVDDGPAQPIRNKVVWTKRPQVMTFEIEGMESLRYEIASLALELDLTLGFENLAASYLRNEKWLIEGKTMTYLPGPRSNVLPEAVEIKRGKKCFYKNQ